MSDSDMHKTYRVRCGEHGGVVTYCKACGNPDCPVARPENPTFSKCPAEGRLTRVAPEERAAALIAD